MQQVTMTMEEAHWLQSNETDLAFSGSMTVPENCRYTVDYKSTPENMAAANQALNTRGPNKINT